MTNESAKVIGKFKKLRYLGLRSNPMNDEGFAHLEACNQLEVIALDGTQVTGKGLPSLYMFPKLEYLSFGAYEEGAVLNDEGLDVLSDMQQLKSLSLNGTDVTDEGMEHVAKLTNLESLSIDYTNVTSS